MRENGSTRAAGAQHPRVRAGFRELLPALSPEELAGLEEQIRAEGCRDPLVVWKETNVLLDGHNRLAICKRLGRPYKTVRLSLPDEAAAVRWVKRVALHRRNLTPEYQALLRGQLYEAEKEAHGGDRKSSPQSGDLIGRTVDRLAADLGVSKNTVDRDGAFARAVARVAGVAPGVAAAVRDGTLSRADAGRLAKAVATNPREVVAAIARAIRGEPALPRPAKSENGARAAEAAPEETPARKWLRLLTEKIEELDGVARNMRHHGVTHLTRKWSEGERAEMVDALQCAKTVLDDLLKECNP